MQGLVVEGGRPLFGEVRIDGSKNGALPILFATLLCRGACTLRGLPDIGDIRVSLSILTGMGAVVTEVGEGSYRISCEGCDPARIPLSLTAGLRASSYLLGACLARFGYCPPLTTGGCDFGTRPLGYHYACFEALGAQTDGGTLTAPHRLRGAIYAFPTVSVGGTVNALLASVTAEGVTRLTGCATEPHVTDFARFLTRAGANIQGIGTPSLTVTGVPLLRGCDFTVAPDDMEAGTYLLAAAATRGRVRVTHAVPQNLSSLTALLTRMGCSVETERDALTLSAPAVLRGVAVETAPYPGFPTDLHPPTVALMCTASTPSVLRERVWADRFRYTEGLVKMGAHLVRAGDTLTVYPARLAATENTATDLRGGAGILIAALTATGRSVIRRCGYLARGYGSLPEKLNALGADVRVCQA